MFRAYCLRLSCNNSLLKAWSITATSFWLILAAQHLTSAATLPTGFSESTIATGLSNPTAMDIAPDGRIFVCLQGGQLRVIKNGSLLTTPFVSLTVDSSGERGLLGVAFDPNFASNNFIYVYYTVPGSPSHNRVSRFTANGDVAVAGSELLLNVGQPATFGEARLAACRSPISGNAIT